MNLNPSGAKSWLWLLLVVLGITTVKAGGHLLRFVILAAVGLCGMWMLHTLAQDFQKIRKGFMSARALLRLRRDVDSFDEHIMIQTPDMSFRSMDENSQMSFLDQSLVGILELDPKGCVKSFVCQIAAMNSTEWNTEENAIMRLINLTSSSKYWPSVELKKALDIGRRKHNIKDCRNQYNSCPFQAKTMLNILRMFKT